MFKEFQPNLETRLSENHKQKAYELIHDIKDKISFYPAANIAGYDDEEAWGIRNELIEKNQDGVVQGLAGITSEKAWRIRESLITVCPHSVARSLVGLNDDAAWQMRDRLLELISKDGVANGLAESVAFIDDDRSWKLRHKLENVCLLNVLEGLNGLDSRRAWDFREKYKTNHPREVAASLIGLSNDKARQWRKEFLSKGQIEGVILSHLGSDSPEAWSLRKRHLKEYAFAVGTSLSGLENEASWELRKELKKKAEKENDSRVYKGLAQSLSSYMSAALKMKR